VSLGLQVPLKSGNHEDYEVGTRVDKQGARQIADSLNKQILRLW
jgi:hypothetical protein